MKKLFTLSALLFAACGDDSPAKPDAGMIDIDAAVDAAIDPYVVPTPNVIAISTDGPDQLMSVAPGPSGTFYAAGFAAETPTGDKFLIVAKLTAAGALDTSFATTGFYTSTLVFKGGSDEIDIAVQSDGKIVVAGTIANDTNPADKDIGLFRVDASGVLDTNFGIGGTSRVNLSTAYEDTTVVPSVYKALDSQRSLAVGPNDTLFIHAASRNDIAGGGTRQDSDFTVARLTAAGILDVTYGVTASTPGRFLLDLSETDGVATAKGLSVLADGSVIAGGYAKTTASNGTPQPVLYRVVPGGAMLDPGFPLFHEVVLTLQTEIYSFAVDNNVITTAGYGRESGTANVWASLRFNATTGARDTTFGGSTGVVTVDPSGMLLGANCRNAVGLPGGKTALIGSIGGAGARDAAVVLLTSTGARDTAFGDGVHTFDLDAGTEDQWWGGAVSGGKLLIVGWRGVGATQTDTANDNSFGVVYDL